MPGKLLRYIFKEQKITNLLISYCLILRNFVVSYIHFNSSKQRSESHHNITISRINVHLEKHVCGARNFEILLRTRYILWAGIAQSI